MFKIGRPNVHVRQYNMLRVKQLFQFADVVMRRLVRSPTFPGMTRPTIKTITYRAPRRIEEEDRTMRKADLHREIE